MPARNVGINSTFEQQRQIINAISQDVNTILTPEGNVYYVNVGGSDSNNGETISQPFLTLKHALAVAQSGDTIKLGTGTFTEIFPLTIPQGVTVQGSGIRATLIQPTQATKQNDGFLLNGETTVNDLTIGNFYEPGVGFKFANNMKTTTRSPYMQRVTVLNRGSVTSSSDPYGFDTAHNPVGLTYKSGRGVLIDASVVDPTTLEPAMLFNECTFITPNNIALEMKDGARTEWVNCFTYFADKAIYAHDGNVGLASTGYVRIKTSGFSGTTPTVNDELYYLESNSQSGTYNQVGTAITITRVGHGLTVGDRIFADFTSGTATDGYYSVTEYVGINTFVVTSVGSATTSGNISYKESLGFGTIRSYDVSSGLSSITGKGEGLFELPSSRLGKTTIAYGNASLSTSQAKFGTASLSLDGVDDYGVIGNYSDFNFGTGDFTIEFWVRPSSIGTQQVILDSRTSSGDTAIYLEINAAGNIRFFTANAYRLTSSVAVTANNWSHVALSRSSGVTRIFVNGTLTPTTYADSNDYSNRSFRIGGNFSGSVFYGGYVDELRISNIARYTSTFTTASGQFNSDGSDKLLLHFDGIAGSTSFIDSSIPTQDIRWVRSGITTATATKITLADYQQFGAEMRSIGSAAVFGNTGVTADGPGSTLRLFAFNFGHIGSGKDFSQDVSLVNQSDEVITLNNGNVYSVSIDQSGDFRVGDAFYVNQEEGTVNFGGQDFTLNSLSDLNITDGTNTTTITPTTATIGSIQISGNQITSTSGDIIINPSGINTTRIIGDLNVGGDLQIANFSTQSITAQYSLLSNISGINLNISGISTLGITSITNLISENIEVSGITTSIGGFSGNLTGNVTGNLTGTATTSTNAVQLQTARIISLSGDVVGEVSFDGTSSVSIAATIQPNSVALGEDTSGNYVATISDAGLGDVVVIGSGSETAAVTLGLSSTGVAADSYGSSTQIPTFTVDSRGRLTAAGTASVGTALTVASDSGSGNVDLLTETLTIAGGTNLTSSASGETVTINLDNNISLTSVVASGVVTATSGFSGDLTGNLTGNVTGNLTGEVNAAAFDTNASGVVVTGVSTFAGITTVTGPTLFTKQLNVSGVSTFGNTINANNGIYINNSNIHIDINGAQIYENLTNLFLKSSAGVVIKGGGGSTNLGIFNYAGSVDLYYNNVKKFETTSDGVTITGGVTASGIITATQFSTGASGSAINITSNTISGPSEITIDPSGVGDNTGAVRIKGDLFVDGTQTIINSTTIEFADFIVGIASTATTDSLADGAGIKIGPDNTLLYDHPNTAFKTSENFNLASGKSYKIDGSDVLTSTSLGSNVVNSSLTSLGTLGQLQVTGVSTFTNGPVLIGSGTSTGTASQPLQVTGSAYISDNFGIGITNPQYKLDVLGDINFTGTFYQNGSQFVASRWTSGTGNDIYRLDGDVGIGTTDPTSRLTVVSPLDSNWQTGLNGNYLVISNKSTSNAISPSYLIQQDYPYNSFPFGYELGSFLYADNSSSRKASVGFFKDNSSGTGIYLSPTGFSGLLGGAGNSGITVRSSGNVGIATENPTSKLHVIGDSLISGILTASSFVKSEGTSSQFLKADGSVDSNTYLTTTGSGSNLTGVVTSITAGSGISIDQSTGNVTITAASVSIGDNSPSSPSSGDLWWKSDVGKLKIYYTDSDSSQWVDAFVPTKGESGTIQIGTVTTGETGVAASVTNSGTSSSAILNFTLPKGNTGTAATITVGSVTTGAPGTAASVINSGTSSNVVLNFTIPRGADGSNGEVTQSDAIAYSIALS